LYQLEWGKQDVEAEGGRVAEEETEKAMTERVDLAEIEQIALQADDLLDSQAAKIISACDELRAHREALPAFRALIQYCGSLPLAGDWHEFQELFNAARAALEKLEGKGNNERP